MWLPYPLFYSHHQHQAYVVLIPTSLPNYTNVPTPITQPHQGCVTLIHTLFYLTTQRLCGSHTHSFVTQQHHVVWLSYPLSSPDNTNARCLSYPPLSPNNTNVVWLPFPLLSPDNTNARWLSYSFLLPTTQTLCLCHTYSSPNNTNARWLSYPLLPVSKTNVVWFPYQVFYHPAT